MNSFEDKLIKTKIMKTFKLDEQQKAYLLKIVEEGYYTHDDLVVAFPESVKEQPLFGDD